MVALTTLPREPKVTKKDGYIPAVYYGAHAKSTPIFINVAEFEKVFRSAGESTTITLKTEHGDEVALIHDIARHPVKNNFAHIDFYVIEKGQKVHVNVPLNFIGESPAVKGGAVLVKVMYELPVEAAPTALPHGIDVDLSKLVSLDSVITAGDLPLTSGVSLYHLEPTEVVAAVSLAKEEEEAAPTAIDMDAIEVEQKGKKEDSTEDTPAAE